MQKILHRHLFKALLLTLAAIVNTSAANPIALKLQHARTEDERAWGLMGRKELKENEGLLLHYPYPMLVHIWMFNVPIDLSVAFLDESGLILQIEELKSHPEKMDPKRPVRSLQDFHLYPDADPVIQFFQRNKIGSNQAVKYALEMKGGWFKRNQVEIGDRLDLHSNAFLLHHSAQ